MEEEARGRRMAVCVRGACRSYGTLKVLQQLDMNVPSGNIYGLLGSSGCGKTTLLRCILGRLPLASGHVTVLGKAPGAKGHQVPGRDVGYMPQELALYGDLTMLETMYYFGILHRMSRSRVRERGRFLLTLLELPSQTKLIRKLSGGQQRRVSFAVAMLQEPPLLLLDEPTVGVDPLLRAKIWHHMLELASTEKTTIIITTHYIEEARQANMVGLMRDGQLLAESEPNSLISLFGMRTLEDVFLHLCRRQDAQTVVSSPVNSPVEDLSLSDEETPLLTRRDSRGRGRGESGAGDDGSEHQFQSAGPCCCRCAGLTRAVKTYTSQACRNLTSTFSRNPTSCCPQPANILALCWKNAAKIYRNPWLVIFQFLIPTLQVSLLCLTIGRDLHGVSLAYFNDDRGGPIGEGFCQGHTHLNATGDWFIDILSKDGTFHLESHASEERAVEQVREGKAWAALIVGQNFTVDLFKRITDYSDRSVIKGSTIELYIDNTNSQISAVIGNNTAYAFELFAKELFKFCNQSSAALSPPVKVHQPPVYGKAGLSFTDYMGPGIIASTALGISIGMSAVVLIQERKEGLMDRTWVAGVNVTEIIISQVITQFFILLVQIILMLVFVLWVFKVYNRSASIIPLLMVLALLQGMTGMSFGLVISAMCGDENTAMQVAIATFYPVLVLSGVLWPLEGMPTVLRYLGSVLPMTYPAQAMRAAMGRGWGLQYEEVWRGFLLGSTWFIVFLFIAAIGLRIRK